MHYGSKEIHGKAFVGTLAKSYLQCKDQRCDDCVFCLPEKTEADDRLVLHRGRLTFVMMNKFPYTNGHLLIAPTGI
ncbi:MAG: hypothetical protein R2864_04835 [Syntrophotaleaceae bacterium]